MRSLTISLVAIVGVVFTAQLIAADYPPVDQVRADFHKLRCNWEFRGTRWLGHTRKKRTGIFTPWVFTSRNPPLSNRRSGDPFLAT